MTTVDVTGERGFHIVESRAVDGEYQPIAPDAATCTECVSDILTPGNRRHGYAFTNCTNCGPRFTIIEDIPYDRPLTTMRHFTMCDCVPAGIRRSAQPSVSRAAECVSGVWATPLVCRCRRRGDSRRPDQPRGRIDRVGRDRRAERPGWFSAVLRRDDTRLRSTRLRHRKHRPAKPFAVMFADHRRRAPLCRRERRGGSAPGGIGTSDRAAPRAGSDARKSDACERGGSAAPGRSSA